MAAEKDKTKPVVLPLDEFAFCVLVQSHSVACQAFGDIVINAIKHSHPTTWIQTIGDCFSWKLKFKIKKQLEMECCLTDIYAICKIINIRLKDVVRFCGGQTLADPREKERFSFQVYGVEEARNWAFHGEGVSAAEVLTNLNFLISISKSLGCEERSQAKFLDLLRILKNSMENKLDACESFIEVSVLAKNFLYRSFAEVEREFHKFFQNGDKTLTMCFSRDGYERDMKVDIQALMKIIRTAATIPKNAQPLPKAMKDIGKKLQGGTVCQKIDKTRNKLAHFEKIEVEEVEKTLSHVCLVLTTFGFGTDATASAINEMPSLRAKERVLCGVPENSQDGSSSFCQRALRPACPLFVGRKTELREMDRALRKRQQGPCVVVLFGSAGIGKSFLATKLVFEQRARFPKQSWICCSTVDDFNKDIQHSFLRDVGKETVSNIAFPQKPPEEGPCQTKTVDRDSMKAHLLVLDDVCSETVGLVCRLVQNTIHSYIITTRGSAVKLQLQSKIPSAIFLTMEPFSVDESCQLITRRNAAITPKNLSVMKDAMGSVLGNIPLCVGVLSSLLLKNTGDFDTGSVEMVKRNWSKIEEEFGDRFHRRGLNGVVQLAMESLQCSPQAFFMLAIICSLEAERVPWDLLCQEQQTIAC